MYLIIIIVPVVMASHARREMTGHPTAQTIPDSRQAQRNCLSHVPASQFTTFYAFLRLFDTYSVPENYLCAGLIQVNARIRSPG